MTIDYQALGKIHPSLARGQVWCRTCGATQRTNSGHNLRHGWPKCCGYTMTIDSPEEQAALAATQDQSKPDDATPCIACLIPLKEGDRFYPDVSGGVIHAGCCGPERESYVGADGEPLKPGEPIPEAMIWTAGPAAVGPSVAESGGSPPVPAAKSDSDGGH